MQIDNRIVQEKMNNMEGNKIRSIRSFGGDFSRESVFFPLFFPLVGNSTQQPDVLGGMDLNSTVGTSLTSSLPTALIEMVLAYANPLKMVVFFWQKKRKKQEIREAKEK